ncbi:MAG: ribosome biogenesis GTP-binding protein YihA/YsxC [Acidobacteriota bacterium]|jgi:GTP-binding protein|nr:ribosome biogenesis GTP-binding protein YihA/YsxC [Acidobacteriota bacterium]
MSLIDPLPAKFPVVRSEFVTSAVSISGFPAPGIPEVVFAGRSNAGKSSLINRLTGNRGLARTSSTPGKTQSVNFYRINGSFYFVDLPGYGYARAGKSAIRSWKTLIEGYFLGRAVIALAIHVVDSRMPPTDLDIQLSGWLAGLEVPRLVVATKSDKLSNNQKGAQLRIISDSLEESSVVMASAATGTGSKEIWKRILEATAVVPSSIE